MGSKVNTRNSKKIVENSAVESKPARQSFGFGLSNLTSSDDNKNLTKSKSAARDQKNTPENGKSSPQLKKPIRKPSPSKKIKSILKNSNTKRSCVEAKPSETMLLLLGGESAKKAQQAKSMLKETTNLPKAATESTKLKEKKQDVNQKVKQLNKAKQSKVEDAPTGITLVGTRRRDKKVDETMERLMMLEAAAEKKTPIQPEYVKQEKNVKKTSPVPSPKPSPVTKQPTIPENKISQPTRSSRLAKHTEEQPKVTLQKVEKQVVAPQSTVQQPQVKASKNTTQKVEKKIAPKQKPQTHVKGSHSSKITSSFGLFSNLTAEEDDAINMDELIGQSSVEIKPAVRVNESVKKSQTKDQVQTIGSNDLFDEIMNVHSNHVLDLSDEYSYEDGEEESASERGEHDGYRSRSRTAEKKVFKIVSQLNKKGRAKKSVDEKIQKAQIENKPVIIQQKLDVPWEQITEVKELLKQNIQQEQEKKKDVLRENQKESVSVAILNALHSVGSKGLFKRIIHYAQENFKEDVVNQIMNELGIRTRRRRERKLEMPLQEMRALQRLEELHRRHPILEEDFEDPGMLSDEEIQQLNKAIKINTIKSIGLDINELVTAEVKDSNEQTPLRQKTYKTFYGNNLSNFVQATDEIDESQASLLDLTPKSHNTIDFDELSGAKHIPSPQKHNRQSEGLHYHDDSIFGTHQASTEKQAEEPTWQHPDALLNHDFIEETVQVHENIFESEQEDAMNIEQHQEHKQPRDAISNDGQDDEFHQIMAEETSNGEGTDLEPVNDDQYDQGKFQASTSSMYHTQHNNDVLPQIAIPVVSASANQGFTSPLKSQNGHSLSPNKRILEEQMQYSPRLVCEPTEEEPRHESELGEEDRESPEVDDEGDYENEPEPPVILEDDEANFQKSNQSDVEEESSEESKEPEESEEHEAVDGENIQNLIEAPQQSENVVIKCSVSPIKLATQKDNESDDGSKDGSNDVWYTPREIPTSEARISGSTIAKTFFSSAIVSVLPEELQTNTEAQVVQETDAMEVQYQLEQEKLNEIITEEIEQIKSKQGYFNEIVEDTPNQELIEAQVLASVGTTPNKADYTSYQADHHGYENPLDQGMAEEEAVHQFEDSQFQNDNRMAEETDAHIGEQNFQNLSTKAQYGEQTGDMDETVGENQTGMSLENHQLHEDEGTFALEQQSNIAVINDQAGIGNDSSVMYDVPTNFGDNSLPRGTSVLDDEDQDDQFEEKDELLTTNSVAAPKKSTEKLVGLSDHALILEPLDVRGGYHQSSMQAAIHTQEHLFTGEANFQSNISHSRSQSNLHEVNNHHAYSDKGESSPQNPKRLHTASDIGNESEEASVKGESSKKTPVPPVELTPAKLDVDHDKDKLGAIAQSGEDPETLASNKKSELSEGGAGGISGFNFY